MMELTINFELRSLIPPLRDEEFKGLEDSILAEGCRDALVIWGDLIIDGHNRFAICQKHGLPFRTHSMDFDGIEDAKLWIINNQLHRRNLSDADRTIMIGRRYETEKNIAQERNGNGQFGPSPQNGATVRTSQRIADDLGIGKNTVERAEQFKDGYERIRDVDPDEADRIRMDKSRLTKTTIQELRKAEPEEIKQAIKDAYAPKPEPAKRLIPITDENRLKTPEEKQYEKAADEFLGIISSCVNDIGVFTDTKKKTKTYRVTIEIANYCEDLINLIEENERASR